MLLAKGLDPMLALNKRISGVLLGAHEPVVGAATEKHRRREPHSITTQVTKRIAGA
jgi:hypothetical protein